MLKFYVNQFYEDRFGLPNIYPNMYIGLFTECKTKGEGNFCGYYGAEYYLDTALLAYYEAEGAIYRPEKRVTDVTTCYYQREKISIGSHMWTRVIEAETFEEALKKFENAQWRRWESPFDEFVMIPISNCPRCGKKPHNYGLGDKDGFRTVFECPDCDIKIEVMGSSTLAAACVWNETVEEKENV